MIMPSEVNLYFMTGANRKKLDEPEHLCSMLTVFFLFICTINEALETAGVPVAQLGNCWLIKARSFPLQLFIVYKVN